MTEATSIVVSVQVTFLLLFLTCLIPITDSFIIIKKHVHTALGIHTTTVETSYCCCSSVSRLLTITAAATTTTRRTKRHMIRLCSSFPLYGTNFGSNSDDFVNEEDEDDDDEDDDDDDDPMDESSLGDWRKFRATLIDTGLPEGDEQELLLEEQDNDNDKSDSTRAMTKSRKTNQQQQQQQQKQKVPQVAVQNEKLLAQQNEQLANEYRTGVWAHTIVQPEVGGLLCRMPIEAELYYSRSSSSSSSIDSTSSSSSIGTGNYWKQKLDIILSFDDTSTDISSPSSCSDGSIPATDNDIMTYNKVNRWFKAAERMTIKELEAIMKSAKNGVLNPIDLGDNERILLNKFLHYKQTWQEVCLVLSHNAESGISETVVLNRPITKSINKELAKVMLDGANGTGKGRGSFNFIDRIVQAFGTEAAVYIGGPHNQDDPAMILHGIPNLQGSYEIAPGTNIYSGGWEAAVHGILNGLYKPLDFRFFLGRYNYNPTTIATQPSSSSSLQHSTLLQAIENGCYQPIACARSLALKQCLGLPKPLWHEVLELCGGEMKVLSKIEIQKRIDLKL